MVTVTGFTADRMLAIENDTVVDGNVVGDDLVLLTKDGTPINAGNVRGAPGFAFGVIELSGSVDLDSIVSSGYYTQSSNVEAASGTNYPTPYSGLLEVVSGIGAAFIWQSYSVSSDGPFANEKFIRTRTAGVWSTWKPLFVGPTPATYIPVSDSGFPVATVGQTTATIVIDRFTISAAPLDRRLSLTTSIYATVTVAGTQLNGVAFINSTPIGYTRVNFATINVPDQIVVVGSGSIPKNTTAVVEVRLDRQSGTGSFTTSISTGLTKTNIQITAA